MTVSSDPTYPLFPIFSFLGFIVCCIPLPWHIQAWNSGTCAFIMWTAVACLIEFVNCIIWTGNVNNPAPVWCDISSKFILGVSVGIPAASLCISRRLYYLTSYQTVSITHQDKRRMVIVDLCIAVGAPAIIMVLHYVVQGHRFNILEDIGCHPVVYNTLPAYFLYFMWPVFFGLISFVFSALTLRSFWIRRAQFNQLITSNSSISVARYFRLVLLAILDMLCTVPLAIYTIYIGNKGLGLAPWISWQDTHFNFSQVDLIPALIWRGNPSFLVSVELTRWLPVVCAFLFFALFGFASEAQMQYKMVFCNVMKRLGIRPSSSTSAKSSTKISSLRWKKSFNSGELSINSLPEYAPKSPILHSVDLELKTFDVEKSAGVSPIRSEFSTIAASPALRSPKSPSSQTSGDLNSLSLTFPTYESNFTDPTSLCKPIARFSQLRETVDNAPEYYQASYPEVYIADDTHPTIGDADTFTISTFSYYAGAPSPSTPSYRFDLNYSNCSLEPQGLSPPPLFPLVKRPIPKNVPTSPDSFTTECLSRPSSPPVPQDVTESSHGRMTMDIPEGIFVTMQKQVSGDKVI